MSVPIHDLPAADPREPFPPELAGRLERAWLFPANATHWWQAPHVPPDVAAGHRARILSALDRAERIPGPPTLRGMLQRPEFEARWDPAMPAWLHRPWFVPAEAMLALDALFEEAFGTGYSAFGTGRAGEDAMGQPPARRGLWLMVKPVPGAIPKAAVRDAVAARATAALAGIGIPNVRLCVWNDTEPAKAYLGMLTGEVIREGHVRLGIPREYSKPEDYDNF